MKHALPNKTLFASLSSDTVIGGDAAIEMDGFDQAEVAIRNAERFVGCGELDTLAYCCFILSCLEERNVNCASLDQEPDDGALADNIQFKIPAGWLAQIYELRRVFRLCM